MEKIKWCIHLKKGIEMVEPNDNLSNAYIKKAEESLKVINTLKQSKDWAISASYYTMYFALYSILMKIGVKCEVHACTIEFMKRFLTDYFIKEECKFLKDSMQARIDVQYYVDRTVSDRQYHEMLKNAPLFLVKCKEILLKIGEKEIRDTRQKLKNIEEGK